MKTIWGTVQRQRKLAEGVYVVHTAGHGGIIVSASVADRYLSARAKAVGELSGGWYHFEEDCDWAVFAKENPAFFDEGCLASVDRIILRYNPGYISGALAKGFRSGPFKATRAALMVSGLPGLDAESVGDSLMQELVDEAAAETGGFPGGAAYLRLYFEAALREAAIRHGVPYVCKVTGWVVTDPDCGQRCRAHVLDDGKTVRYEYQQDDAGVEADICVRQLDYMDEKFAEDYLRVYGYESVDHVKTLYGAGWEQILAECFFEQTYT